MFTSRTRRRRLLRRRQTHNIARRRSLSRPGAARTLRGELAIGVLVVALLGLSLTSVSAHAGPELGARPGNSTAPTPPTAGADDRIPDVSGPIDGPGQPPTDSPSLPPGYQYLRIVGETPVLVDACVPVVYTLDPNGAPPGGLDVLTDAVTQAAAMTGLELRTSTTNSAATQMKIAFRHEDHDHGLEGSAIGIARTQSVQSGSMTYIASAEISLEIEWFADSIGPQHDVATMVVLHEIGHSLGLGHATDSGSILYHSAGATAPSDSDRQAFNALNVGCSDGSSAAEALDAPRVVTAQDQIVQSGTQPTPEPLRVSPS